jgi:hypothetical protein
MKKKFFSGILALFLTVACVASVTACGGSTPEQSDGGSSPEVSVDDSTIFGTEESEGLAYSLSKDETYYLVSGLGECKDTKIVIPAEYNNRPVLGVGEGNSQLGAGAFEGCSTLESVVLPDGATTIGAAAFASCRSLKRISIPDSITFIQETAFNGCSALVYNEYENGKYLGNKTNPYVVLAGGKTKNVTTVTVHESAVMILTKAFNKHSSLTGVTFQNAEGWTASSVAIAKADLENAQTAATYLTDTYCSRLWIRAK